MQHIKAEGCALYEKHARMQPNGLPGVALKVPISSPWYAMPCHCRGPTLRLQEDSFWRKQDLK